MPTVATMGSRALRDAATKHTEQSTHQVAIWAALAYAGTCLTRGSRVTLTIESVTALRNLRAAPADAETHEQEGGAAQGGATEKAPQRDGAARPAPGGGNKRQRPNPRPDLKRGREADERETREGARPRATRH